MSDTIILVWVIAVTVLALNGFAAGVAALFYARKSMRGGSRNLLAAALAGLLPASLVIVVPLAQAGAGEEPYIWLLAFAILFAVSTGVSLPGAIIVSRKLEKPGDEFRAFE